jgi:5-dehydro-2-deoxygluconokinase
LRTVLPDCDLIVGTEEEIMIAGGADSVTEALAAIRAVTDATIVLKRGAMGCIVYEGLIPQDLEDGIVGEGFGIEVYNVLGAGDAFMSGFLAGWLRHERLAICATWANACGAFAVSRLLCSPDYPTRAELDHFLAHGSSTRALRKDAELNHIHWATTRRRQSGTIMAFAIDHRAQLEEIADRAGAKHARIADFKLLAVEAAARVADGRPGFGMLLDSTYGTKALFRAAHYPFWIGRPVEQPGSRPLDFDQLPDLGSHLLEWPVGHTVKCLCFYHPDDAADLKARQERELLRLSDAARTVGRELLIEIIAGKHGSLEDDTVARIISRLYDLNIRPDWWKLEPQTTSAAWKRIATVITERDPYCRGVMMLGLDAPEVELASAFKLAATEPMVKGFAVGRTIFGETAVKWFAGDLSDEAAIADMAARFQALVGHWQAATANAKERA